ncbi:MAG: carbohydrate binding domain-containing protein [Bacillota bacterium]
MKSTVKKYIFPFLLLIAVSVISGVAGADKNLLKNPGFEQELFGWRTGSSRPGYSLEIEKNIKHAGKYALKIITGDQPNDVFLSQNVKVKPNRFYCLSAWIKGANIRPAANVGANVCIVGGFVHEKIRNEIKDWQHISMSFKTHPRHKTVEVAVRLGFWCNEVMGAAYFDDVRLTELKKAPAGFHLLDAPAAAEDDSPAEINNTGAGNAGNKSGITFPAIRLDAKGKSWLLQIFCALAIASTYAFLQGKTAPTGQKDRIKKKDKGVK